MQIRRDLIFTEVCAESREDILTFLSETMVKKGLVKESYTQALLEREREFPTGLNTSVLGIAIPHADSCHVLANALALAKLKNPVEFCHMADEGETVEAEVVILMSLTDGSSQLPMLKGILDVFSESAFGWKIRQAKSADELYHLLQERLGAIQTEKREGES